jgi:hypothetical protein
MNAATEQESHLRLIIDALTQPRSLAHVRATLTQVACTSSDKELSIYLAPVREVFASVALTTMNRAATMELPIERQPYSALIAYCRRRLGT